MEIIVFEYSAVVLSKSGKRPYNEDAHYPSRAATGRTFLICDGVGGSNKGEMASQLVCSEMSTVLESLNQAGEDSIRKAIANAEDALKSKSAQDSHYCGMATTLVGLHTAKNKEEAWVFWVGDSRMYHIRNGKILFKTKDHSLVQMMIDNGEIPESDAKDYPMRNVILQALDDSGKRAEADVQRIDKIEAGDIFLLMSDGILEGCSETELTELFQQNSPEGALAEVDRRCAEKSNDNYSLVAVKANAGK